MKRILFTVATIINVIYLTSCGSSNTQTSNGVTTTKSEECNLDIPALTQLVKSSNSVADIEDKLNQAGGINNVDLDKDGNTDFIKVSESVDNTGNSVILFVDALKDGDVTLVTMSFNKTQNTVAAVGDPHYYGYNNEYHSNLTDFLILSYMFAPHHYYMSPYHYGYYSPRYTSYRTVSRTVYNTRSTISSARTNTNIKPVPHSASSPSKAPMVQSRSLNGQTSFQKSFTKRDVAKPINSTGFKSSSSTPTKSSGFGSSSPSRSSSYGSSSSSRSSSFGSSSSSRSSGFSSSRSSSSSSSRRR